MIKSDSVTFNFRGRNRRPPQDPVNAVLSFLYAMLIRQATVVALTVGFDLFPSMMSSTAAGCVALSVLGSP